MSRWFKTVAKPAPTMVAEEEDQHLQQVEQALLQLLNDDIAEADRILKQENSSYHHLGRGISSFIASMLGVEKELLKEAASILQASEKKSWDDMQKAQREPTAFQSSIYAPGTEYLLCFAVSQLTSAICAVLSGSVTEAIKGFYKLRKAYITLDGIMEAESTYIKRVISSRRSSFSKVPSAGRSSTRTGPSRPNTGHDGTSEAHGELDEKAGLEPGSTPNESLRDVRSSVDHGVSEPLHSLSLVESHLLDVDPVKVGITNHTDIFIHSGTRLCYGILLVVFSMIENPLFNRILYIVGFKGDRERGTRYLWQAARFNNFNSAIAGITLLAYYNGLVGFCDILPTDEKADEDLGGFPRGRCNALLIEMRKRYPESKLWRMEEARMHGYNKNLPAALKILTENANSNMKQIATINMFEMSLTAMFVHDYELCAKSWIKLADLSTWSPTLYAYFSAINYLEIYRNLRTSDPTAAKLYKEKATEYFKKGPPLVGKQKVMGKQLPFEMYIVRKIQKWEERAKTWNVDLVDSVGVSPLVEMVYFWGGAKKESQEELQKSLDLLSWDRTGHPDKFKADLDETAIQATLRACLLRNMKKYAESKAILEKEVLSHDRAEFRGHLKDDWSLPAANYEMACLAWREKDLPSADMEAKVRDCEQWLNKVHQWNESYIMDTRMSMRVTTSIMTVKRHKKILGMP